MAEQETNLLVDDRQIPVFIKSDIDELGLTLEAFRVYGHLARRAGHNNTAFPSYTSMGELCFRGSYPNSSAASLKAKAIAAINELLAYGLIRKEVRKKEEGGNQTNVYRLTETGFKKPIEPIDSCNVRKGNPGKERKKREESPERLTGITPPVNGDNPLIESKAVNGDNPPRLTGITPPVNGDNPKVLPSKVLHSEGTPHSQEGKRDKKTQQPASEGKEEKQIEPEPQQPVPEINSLPVKERGESSSTATNQGSDHQIPPANFSTGEKQGEVKDAFDLDAGSWPIDFPWRIDRRRLHPMMERAVFEIKNGCDFAKLPNGKLNRPSIEQHVSRLESYSRLMQGESTIENRKKLLAYWDYALTLIESERQVNESLQAPVPSNPPEMTVNPYEQQKPTVLSEEMRAKLAKARADLIARNAEKKRRDQEYTKQRWSHLG